MLNLAQQEGNIMDLGHPSAGPKIDDQRFHSFFCSLLAMVADDLQRLRVQRTVIEVLCAVIVRLCKSEPILVFLHLIVHVAQLAEPPLPA